MGTSLVPGEKLCSLCKTNLQKSVHAPGDLPALADVPLPGPSTSALNVELPLSASTESTSDESVAHVVETDEVIQYLNQSPVKLGKPRRMCNKGSCIN